jgi:hypothetical protein
MSDIVVYGARDCPARDSVSLAALKKNEERRAAPACNDEQQAGVLRHDYRAATPECRIETWALMQLVKGIAANGFLLH